MKRTPGRTNVTFEQFLAGIAQARERRRAFAEMSRPRRQEAQRVNSEPRPKRGRAWRRLDDDARREVVAALQVHLDDGLGIRAAATRVAADYGLGVSTVRGIWYEARYAAQLREAAP